MVWYKKTLVTNKNNIIETAIVSILFALACLVWHFILGKNFVWKNISPISAPDFFERTFYNALVFITLGAFLYFIKFYQFLHTLLVKILDDWRLYKDAKKLLWGTLMLIMYFWIVPKTVDLLNNIISFFYNILGLLIYLYPPLGFTLILYGAIHLLIKKYH